MTTKHTSRPWRISGSRIATSQGIGNLIICHGDNDTFSPMIAEIYNDGGRLPYEANAQLIATAPELLSALKGMIIAHNLSMWKTTNRSDDDVIETIKQIINKAEGKEVTP